MVIDDPQTNDNTSLKNIVVSWALRQGVSTILLGLILYEIPTMVAEVRTGYAEMERSQHTTISEQRTDFTAALVKLEDQLAQQRKDFIEALKDQRKP